MYTFKPDTFSLMVQAEARDFGHRQILQILAVARVRLCSAYRRWDAVQSALDQLSDLLNWSEDSLTSTRLSSESAEWHTSLTAHYLLLRSLWEGRIGHDAKCRGLLKRLYLLMDEAADSGLLDRLRQNGGLIEVSRDNTYGGCFTIRLTKRADRRP